MITARIGHDHFLVWRLPRERATALVPGLAPVIDDGAAWLLCAAAEFERWRFHGLPMPGRLRTAAWLVPCALAEGRVGNAFVRRFIDHALLPHRRPLAGWTRAAIRLTADAVDVAGQAIAHAGAPAPAPALAWFTADRCGLIPGARGWSRWPIAKRDWTWRFRHAVLRSPVADDWGAQAVGMITVRRTLARWGVPVALA